MFSLLGLFIFLLPLCLSSSNVIEPETLLSAVYSVLLLAFLIAWITVKGLFLKKSDGVRYSVIALMLLLAIAIPFASDSPSGPWEIFLFAVGFLLFLVVAPLSGDQKKRLVSEIVLGALVISLLAIFQYFHGFQLLSDYVEKAKISDPFVLEKIAQRRVFFPFPIPGILGGYLAMVLPLAFVCKRGVFAIPIGLALLLTQSLSAWLSVVIVMAVYFISKTRLSKKKALFLLALGVILSALFVFRANNIHRHLLPSFSVMARLDYWKETWQIIATHPLFGTGLGNFDLLSSRYAHNSFLQLWAETGLVGVTALGWLWTAILANGWKNTADPYQGKQKLALCAGIGIFLVHNLMDFTFFLPAVSWIWWTLLGLFYSPIATESENGIAGTRGKSY